jgi:hypothetical protein
VIPKHQIKIDGQSGEIAHKQIDGRAAIERKRVKALTFRPTPVSAQVGSEALADSILCSECLEGYCARPVLREHPFEIGEHTVGEIVGGAVQNRE